MAFWNRKKEKEVEERACNCNSMSLPFFTNGIEGASQSLSSVYACTELIGNAIAMLPINVHNINAEHDDIDYNHPLQNWFEFGSLLSKFTTMKLLINSMILRGNGFAYIVRDKNGTPIDLQYKESGEVTINYNQLKGELYYTVQGIKGRVEPINLIHLVNTSHDGVVGLSVLKFAKRNIDLANATENTAKSFFSNGGNLSGILKVNGNITDEQKNDIRNNWAMTYGNDGKGIAVLRGNMEYQPIQSNNADSQMLETRKYNLIDLARFFNIPPSMLGDGQYSSQVELFFLQHTLQPIIRLIEDEFNRKLIKPSERKTKRITLDTTYYLKSDKQTTASYYNTLITNGVLCINEVRKELGYAPIDGGDEHIIAYTKIEDNTIGNTDNNETDKD